MYSPYGASLSPSIRPFGTPKSQPSSCIEYLPEAVINAIGKERFDQLSADYLAETGQKAEGKALEDYKERVVAIVNEVFKAVLKSTNSKKFIEQVCPRTYVFLKGKLVTGQPRLTLKLIEVVKEFFTEQTTVDITINTDECLPSTKSSGLVRELVTLSLTWEREDPSLDIREVSRKISQDYDEGESSQEYSPIHEAAYEGHGPTIRWMIEKNGWDINNKTKEGKTPIYFVRDPERVALLVDLGADLEIQDEKGHTPLHFAVIFGTKLQLELAIVKELVNQGGDLTTQDKKGNTPLALATLLAEKKPYAGKYVKLLTNLGEKKRKLKTPKRKRT